MIRDFGQYEILEKIGVGGMATVYTALQKSLGRRVVLKVMHGHLQEDPTFVARFEREAKSAAMLSHENIVQVIDYGQEDGIGYIAMELVEGVDLKKWLECHGPPPVEVGAYLLYDLCAGLEHAHSHGIIHRDLKPANIMLAPTGAPKIADFGLARMTQESTVLTVHDAMIGTIPYMSPESATGDPVDVRSDIFSLGIVAYELFGGRRPFEGKSSASLIQAILSVDPPELDQLNPAVPPDLKRVVSRMLEKEKGRRFKDAGELRRALEEVIDRLGITRGRDLLAGFFNDPSVVRRGLKEKRRSPQDHVATLRTPSVPPPAARRRRGALRGGAGIAAAGAAAAAALLVAWSLWSGGKETEEIARGPAERPAETRPAAAAGMDRPDPVRTGEEGRPTEEERGGLPEKETAALPAPEQDRTAGGESPAGESAAGDREEREGATAAPAETPGATAPSPPAPRESAPPAPEEGTLRIVARPFATFRIDGEVVARDVAVLERTVRPGEHRIRVEHPYYEAREWSSARVEAGRPLELTHDFQAGHGDAFLTVTTNRIPALVWIDGLPIDLWTPQREIPVPPGPHRVTVKKDGFRVAEGIVEKVCREGKTTEIAFTLARP